MRAQDEQINGTDKVEGRCNGRSSACAATRVRQMTKVLPYFRCAVFDPYMTHIMGEAFDRACEDLHVVGQPDIVKEVIAGRIIDAARDGERDPRRLYEQALNASGFKRQFG